MRRKAPPKPDTEDDLALGVHAQMPAWRLVRTSHNVRVLAVVLVGLMVTVGLSLVFVPWQQSVAGTGRVIAYSPVERHQRLESPVDGRIVEVLVLEGQEVKEDEVVVEIADVDPRFLERLDSERNLVRARQIAADSRVAAVGDRIGALVQAKGLALSAAAARIDMASERVRQAEAAFASAEAHKRTADQNLPRVQLLAEQGARSRRDAELAELEVKKAEADLARAQATTAAALAEVTSLQRERERVEKEITAGIEDARANEQIANAELAAAAGELVRLETRIARQQTQAVTVPRDSIVFRVLVQDGQLVKQGDPLVELVPQTTSRAVEIWVDGNDAPLVSPGRQVRLQFEGWPALQFVGWPELARGTFGGVVSIVDSYDDGQGRFRLVVSADPNEPPWPEGQILRQGGRANAWVLLSQVSIGYELWRRLNAFPPLMEMPKKSWSSSSSSKSDPGAAKP